MTFVAALTHPPLSTSTSTSTSTLESLRLLPRISLTILSARTGMVQHSNIARSAMTFANSADSSHENRPNGVSNGTGTGISTPGRDPSQMAQKTVVGRALGSDLHSDAHRPSQASKNGVGCALTDTPISTAPPSPQMYDASGAPLWSFCTLVWTLVFIRSCFPIVCLSLSSLANPSLLQWCPYPTAYPQPRSCHHPRYPGSDQVQSLARWPYRPA